MALAAVASVAIVLSILTSSGFLLLVVVVGTGANRKMGPIMEPPVSAVEPSAILRTVTPQKAVHE